MLISPMREETCTCGGGAITPSCDSDRLRRTASTTGGGAIAMREVPKSPRDAAVLNCGGGATTTASTAGNVSLGVVETVGTGAIGSVFSDHAMMLGRGTSSFNLT